MLACRVGNPLHQSTLFEPKQVFLLDITIRITCKNTSLNNSDSWCLILQTCFHCKIYYTSLCVPPLMQYHKIPYVAQYRMGKILANDDQLAKI